MGYPDSRFIQKRYDIIKFTIDPEIEETTYIEESVAEYDSFPLAILGYGDIEPSEDTDITYAIFDRQLNTFVYGKVIVHSEELEH